MEHLKNILTGVGNVLAAFGTAPSYRYPEVGDRLRDAQQISGDWVRVGTAMNTTLTKEKSIQDGSVNDCAGTR